MLRSAVGALVAVMLCSNPLFTQASEVQEIRTPSGIPLWLVQQHEIPIVAVRFSFAGGASADPEGREGITSLTGMLLTEGAGDLDAVSFPERLISAGARLGISTSRDRITGSFDFLAARREEAEHLLQLVVREPRFDPEAVERVKEQRLMELDIAAKEPRRVALERWYKESFPGQPLGRPVDGTVASITALTRAAIVSHAKELLDRGRLKVVIVGDIDRGRAERMVDRIFGSLPAGSRIAHMPMESGPRTGVATRIVDKQPLSIATFGATIIEPSHPDYAALEILNHMIGSGDFDSVLMEELRVKRGLAYSVSSSLVHEGGVSLVIGGMATNNENLHQAVQILSESMSHVAAGPLFAVKLEPARSHLRGSWVLDMDSNSKLAGLLLRLWNDGHSPRYLSARASTIDSVTPEDVMRVARSVLDWQRFNVVTVGPDP